MSRAGSLRTLAWRAWQTVTVLAVGSSLVWARERWALLASPGATQRCRVVAGEGDVLPANCWLVRGVLGLDQLRPAVRDLSWVAAVATVAFSVIGLVLASSRAQRRQGQVVVGFGISVGLWVSVWAFGANAAAAGDALGWPARAVSIAPAALVSALAIAGWYQSPWAADQRVSVVGGATRRHPTPGSDAADGSPPVVPSWVTVTEVPSPIRLRWPVDPAQASWVRSGSSGAGVRWPVSPSAGTGRPATH